jgi:hypothetical protein
MSRRAVGGILQQENKGAEERRQVTMARFLCLVSTNSVTGRSEEFNEWYDSQHLPDLLRVPGIVSAQRYRLAELREAQSSEYEYLAIYEIETDDLNKVPAAIAEALRSGRMPTSPAFDHAKFSMLYFEPITKNNQ